MAISITANVTFRHGTEVYTQGSPYSVADNLAHLFMKRNWASGTTSGSKFLTMTADWREGTTLYQAGQTYSIPQPLADFLLEIGLATEGVSDFNLQSYINEQVGLGATTITLPPGLYNQGIQINAPVTLIGTGVTLFGAIYSDKGAVEIEAGGSGCVIDGLHIRDVPYDENLAGFRCQCEDFTIRNCTVERCNTAILSGSHITAGTVLIEGNTFKDIYGDGVFGGQTHIIYLAGQHDQATVRNNRFQGIYSAGHTFKSRAKATTLQRNRLIQIYHHPTQGDRVYGSRSMDFSWGGTVLVEDNVIQHGDPVIGEFGGATGANTDIIGFARETSTMPNDGRVHSLTIRRNRFVIDQTQTAIQIVTRNSLTTPVITFTDNIIVGQFFSKVLVTDIPQNIPFDEESGTIQYENRAAAGLDPFPAFPYDDLTLGTFAWLAATTPLTYNYIADTRNDSIDPDPPAPSQGSNGPSQKLEAWGSIGWSEARGEGYLGCAGGHTNYHGDELQRFVAYVDKPYWEELLPPSPAGSYVPNARRHLTGQPASAHCYWDRYFNDSRDEFWAHRLSSVDDPSLVFNVLERWSRDTGEWLPEEDCPSILDSNDFGFSKCKHPVTEDVYWLDTAGRLRVTRSSDLTSTTITTLLPSTPIYNPMGIDPTAGTAGKILRWAENYGEFWEIDCETGELTRDVQVAGPVPSDLQGASFQWAGKHGKILIVTSKWDFYWAERTGEAQWTIEAITVAGTKPDLPGVGTIFHRAIWSDTLECALLFPNANQNVCAVPIPVT